MKIKHVLTGILLFGKVVLPTRAKKEENDLPKNITQYLKQLKAMGYNTQYNEQCKDSLSPSLTLVGVNYSNVKYPPLMPNTGIVFHENNSEICTQYPMVDQCVPRIDVNYNQEELTNQLYFNAMGDIVDILCFLDPKIKSSLNGFMRTGQATVDNNGKISLNNGDDVFAKVNFAVEYFRIQDTSFANVEGVLRKEMTKTLNLSSQEKKMSTEFLALIEKILVSKEALSNVVMNSIPERSINMANQILSALAKAPKTNKNALAVVGGANVLEMKNNLEKRNKKTCIITAR